MEKNVLTELDKVMKERGVKIPYLSTVVDIPKDRIYKWYQQETKIKVDDANKIWGWINGKNEGDAPQKMEDSGPGFNYDARQNPQNQHNSNTSNNNYFQDLIESNRRLIETQFNYSQAQKQLADAQKILAESHKGVVDNNTTLTNMLNNYRAETTVSADPEIQEAVLVKLDGLQQLLIEVGVGKLWKTKAEGEDRLHREFSSLVQKSGKGRKTAGEGIVHR